MSAKYAISYRVEGHEEVSHSYYIKIHFFKGNQLHSIKLMKRPYLWKPQWMQICNPISVINLGKNNQNTPHLGNGYNYVFNYSKKIFLSI